MSETKSSKILPLEHMKGSKRLLEAEDDKTSQHTVLFPYFSSQKTNTTCGIQSACIMLNVLRSRGILRGSNHNRYIPFEETKMMKDIEKENDKNIVDIDSIRKIGLTLDQVKNICIKYGAVGSYAHHVSEDDINLDTFRKLAISALKTSSNRKCMGNMSCILVNYDMSMLGQCYSGHMCPLAAYHIATDSFLLLDVWPHTPVGWVSAKDLWAAMYTIDNESKKTRGFVIIQGEVIEEETDDEEEEKEKKEKEDIIIT